MVVLPVCLFCMFPTQGQGDVGSIVIHTLVQVAVSKLWFSQVPGCSGFLQDVVADLWSGALLRQDGAKEKVFVADQVWNFSQDSDLACLVSRKSAVVMPSVKAVYTRHDYSMGCFFPAVVI